MIQSNCLGVLRSINMRRVRHRTAPGNGVSVTGVTTATKGDSFALRFFEPQWAVTPGRSAVLFDGKVCLGGGVIDSTSAS